MLAGEQEQPNFYRKSTRHGQLDDVCTYHLNYVILCCKCKVISTLTRHYILSDVPDEGAVTLFYSPSRVDYYRGLLLVWLNGRWGVVSDSSWTIDDVNTVCRQLGRNGKVSRAMV